MIDNKINDAVISISQADRGLRYSIICPWHVVVCISHGAHTLSALPQLGLGNLHSK